MAAIANESPIISAMVSATHSTYQKCPNEGERIIAMRNISSNRSRTTIITATAMSMRFDRALTVNQRNSLTWQSSSSVHRWRPTTDASGYKLWRNADAFHRMHRTDAAFLFFRRLVKSFFTLLPPCDDCMYYKHKIELEILLIIPVKCGRDSPKRWRKKCKPHRSTTWCREKCWDFLNTHKIHTKHHLFRVMQTHAQNI